jgi:CRP/FNR family transcriptional regulator, cyclic AMP receptor protein
VNGSDVSVRSELLLEAIAETGRASAYSAGTPKLVAQVLAEIPVFADLSGRQRHRIAEQAEIAQIKGGTAILREGFTGAAAFVLLTGAARVERGGIPVAVVESGTMIGELSLLTGRPRSATVIATEDLWVLRIRRATFRRLLEREPAIAVHLLETVGGRLWEAEQEMATR